MKGTHQVINVSQESFSIKCILKPILLYLQGNPYASIKNDAAAAAVAGAAALSGSAADMAAYQQLPAAGYYPGYDPMAAYG